MKGDDHKITGNVIKAISKQYLIIRHTGQRKYPRESQRIHFAAAALVLLNLGPNMHPKRDPRWLGDNYLLHR